jgi:hypothetical protein
MTLLFILSACSSSASPHQTYTYGTYSCPSNATVYPHDAFATVSLQAESHLNLKWEPSPGPLSTEMMPSPVNLSATLLGPFSSWSDAKQAGQQNPPGVSTPIVVSMPPIQTNDWVNKTYTGILKLPQGLVSGFYVEIERAKSVSSIGTSDSAGACVLKFTP